MTVEANAAIAAELDDLLQFLDEMVARRRPTTVITDAMIEAGTLKLLEFDAVGSDLSDTLVMRDILLAALEQASPDSDAIDRLRKRIVERRDAAKSGRL